MIVNVPFWGFWTPWNISCRLYPLSFWVMWKDWTFTPDSQDPYLECCWSLEVAPKTSKNHSKTRSKSGYKSKNHWFLGPMWCLWFFVDGLLQVFANLVRMSIHCGGSCDDGCVTLATALGWEKELRELQATEGGWIVAGTWGVCSAGATVARVHLHWQPVTGKSLPKLESFLSKWNQHWLVILFALINGLWVHQLRKFLR